MIDLNREKFEKLPDIEKRLVFIDDFYDNKYHSINNSSVADFINGAWYAFQEQQKKLDCCREENKAHLEKIDAVLHAIAQSELHGDRAILGFQDEIKELLK